MNFFGRSHPTRPKHHTRRRKRERRKRIRTIMRTFSSEVFQHSPLPGISHLHIGPQTLVLGGLGMGPRPITLDVHMDKPSKARKPRKAEPHKETTFLEDVTNASHFLNHVQSFMLNCDILRVRKDEVQERREVLENEKAVIIKEMRNTSYQLFQAIHLELNCKRALTKAKAALKEAKDLYNSIETQAIGLFGKKAFRSPKEQVSSELFDNELEQVLSAHMPPD